MPPFWRRERSQRPSLVASFIPLIALIIALYMAVDIFGADSTLGANQLALLAGAAVAVAISMGIYGGKWIEIEEAIKNSVYASSTALVILLLIGSLSGTWMTSGVVPTMICYGLELLNPKIFLFSACVICAFVSLITGSSWTTIATIGVALIGIGSALGFYEGWVAGAIISGAYFGDKLSMLSDTTIMASSTVGVPIFKHIRYMLITTVPSFVIALLIFLIAGVVMSHNIDASSTLYAIALKQTFNISPWLLLVPVATGLLIIARAPAIITLFLSTFMAAIALIIFQPEIVAEIACVPFNQVDMVANIKAAMISSYSSTAIVSPLPEVTELIATRGMEGMMITIWLILCAMIFGGVMTGSGMLARITDMFMSMVKRTSSIVGSTLMCGVALNICTSDQYISILLLGRLFKNLYSSQNLEGRLLSRTVEDSASVTSVLIPWNSCGMAQSTVLGVSTMTYLPYSFFNILSPIVSYVVALSGYKIYRNGKLVTNKIFNRAGDNE